MFEGLRRFFSGSRPPLSEEARTFITQLAVSNIWVLAIGVRGTPALPSPDDPSAADVVVSHRKELTDLGDGDSIFPFNFKQGRRQILPFFTTEEFARTFLARQDMKEVAIFQPYCLLAGFVATPEQEAFELVLDPGFTSVRTLGWDERLLLRSLSNAS